MASDHATLFRPDAFFAVVDFAFAASARFSAQRLFVAAMIRFNPSDILSGGCAEVDFVGACTVVCLGRMPTQMKHIAREMVRDILNRDPREAFDSHWLEQRILRYEPIAFARELLEFAAFPDPLHRFSMAFSQWFGALFAPHVVKDGIGKVTTPNLAGDLIENQGWRKVNPGSPIP